MVLMVIIHEMTHLWQFDHSKPSRGGYHNKEFCSKLKELGLQPIDPKTGQNITCGQAVSDKLIEDSKVHNVLVEIPEECLFPFSSSVEELPEGDDGNNQRDDGNGGNSEKKKRKKGRSGKRNKYTCGECGLNAWAKEGAELICGKCHRLMIAGQ